MQYPAYQISIWPDILNLAVHFHGKFIRHFVNYQIQYHKNYLLRSFPIFTNYISSLTREACLMLSKSNKMSNFGFCRSERRINLVFEASQTGAYPRGEGQRGRCLRRIFWPAMLNGPSLSEFEEKKRGKKEERIDKRDLL